MQDSVPSCCCFSRLTLVVPSCNIDCLDTLSSSNCVQFAWRWQDKNERPVLRSLLTCVETLKDRLATFTRDELFPPGCAEKACRTAQRVASWPGALARVHCYVLPRALFIIVFFPIMWTGDWKPVRNAPARNWRFVIPRASLVQEMWEVCNSRNELRAKREIFFLSSQLQFLIFFFYYPPLYCAMQCRPEGRKRKRRLPQLWSSSECNCYIVYSVWIFCIYKFLH